MASIGIRKLRQNASQYLRRVAAGESTPDPDIWSTPALPREPGQPPPSATLQAMREDERF